MAETQLESEVNEVLSHIESGRNFLLSGGAGSGKTFSLVQVIKEVIRLNPRSQIACITYTNAAVKEIQERVAHSNLRVSTIHDFLWDMIKNFQKEIKSSLLELVNDPDSKIPNPNVDNTLYENAFEDGIQYQEHLSISKGIIAHNEVLLVANLMYKKYKRLCDILKDKYKFIFLDEYQDTSPVVTEILLEHIQKSEKGSVVGFFGDSMQSIYEDGVGDLNSYVESQQVIEIRKLQNRRNPQSVIDLANQLRLDSLKQEASKDDYAPNMENGAIKLGSATFLYSLCDDLDKIRQCDVFQSWDFTDSLNTKELNLTHNLIATKAMFRKLMDIYDKDPLIQLKSDIVKKIKDGRLTVDENLTFEEVIGQASLRNRARQLRIDAILNDPNQSELYNELYDFLKTRPFSEVRQIYLDKDSLIDDKKDDPESKEKKGSKRDNLIKHLFKIQDLIFFHESKKQ